MVIRRYYPTIVLSDIHLGSEHSRTREVTDFLKRVNCGRLILNGDIIDGWQLQRSGKIVKDYLLNTRDGKRYLVTHGDVFDTVTTNMRWLAKLGDVGYTFLLWLNKIYNRRRERLGKPYFSLSQQVKHKVKSAVSYISEFEKELVALAESKHVDGIICGHIHQAANTWYGKIHYLNSGDWVESMTALVEDEDGQWEVLTYSEAREYADAV